MFCFSGKLCLIHTVVVLSFLLFTLSNYTIFMLYFKFLKVTTESISLRLSSFIFSFSFLTYFYCCSSTVVSISPLHSSPHLSHHHFPPLILPPISFIHVSFIHAPENPPHFSPLLSPSTSPLVTVSLFLISMSLAMFCSIVCFVH